MPPPPTMAAMDEIRLHGIEVWARHGATPGERQHGQPFVVHVTLELDLEAAGASDDLADTVDYGPLAARVAEAAGGGPYQLLETVARRVLDVLLADDRVTGAEVTVEKPHAPLPVAAAGVSVTLRRER
jgi:7,8-dihydroneopterin aldolase/epimerase/oxygenase